MKIFISDQANFCLKCCPVLNSFLLYFIIIVWPCLELGGVRVRVVVSLPTVAK